jgi:ABC-type lipoprotein export system ATPase subunit
MNELLVVKNLVKNYKTSSETLKILDGVNFALSYGEAVSIAGESGSGKSTFLNMISGLDSATSGEVLFEGTELTKLDEDQSAFLRNKKIGFIFQDHFLIDELTALENVMTPYLLFSYNKKEAKDKALSLLRDIGLDKRASHFPDELSGGERQRVAIARAFVNDPALILADEPTGNLDKMNAERTLELLLNISKNNKRSLVIVTHSLQIVKSTDKSYYLENGKLFKIKK